VVPNVMDFAASPPSISEQGQGLRDDLGIGKRGEEILILQPSRIVARKGIEYALLLVQALQSIPYGKPITLVISHLSGDEGFEYEESLRKQAQGASVRLLMIGERVQESAGYAEDGSAIYALADVYHQADFVTYPSLYEGFGNALLESLWYGKPTLVNRYSVFRDDIETLVPESLKLVSIDGQITTECVDEVQALLNDPQ